MWFKVNLVFCKFDEECIETTVEVWQTQQGGDF